MSMKRYQHYIFDWGDTLMADLPLETGPMYAWSRIEVVPGAKTLLAELSGSAACSLATNAADSSESEIRKALIRADLNPYLTNIFCFQNTGAKKPSKAFFNAVHSALNPEKSDKSDILMIGDNLEQDVLGALNFGFDAVWYNPGRKQVPENIPWVHHLSQILDWHTAA